MVCFYTCSSRGRSLLLLLLLLLWLSSNLLHHLFLCTSKIIHQPLYIFVFWLLLFLSSQNYRKLCKRDNLSILIATKTKQFQLLLNTSRVWHWIISFCLFLFSLLCLIVINNTINKNKNKKNKTCHRSLILAIVINFCKKNSLSHK